MSVSELEPVAESVADVVDDASIEVEVVEVEVVEVDSVEVDSVEVDVVETDVLEDDDVLLLEEVEVESELVLPVWEPTGDPQVDAALDLLTTLDPDDVHQHAAVFDEIHQGLRGRLSDLDAS